MSTRINNWMSWEAGVDLAACTQEGQPMPNVVIHVARLVHTPVGSAPSGMILFQPDLGGAPQVLGFVSSDAEVAAYFGPNVFAGTAFESAPALLASIDVEVVEGVVRSRVEVDGILFETELTGVGQAELVNRDPGGMSPFYQQGVECAAAGASLKVNGEEISLFLPESSLSGGAPAVFAPIGIYAR